MIFQKRKSPIYIPSLQIANIPIEVIDEFNFLGITLDKQLNFKTHIAKLSSKLAYANFVLNRVKRVFPMYIMKSIYFALVHSHLSYGILVWGSRSEMVLKQQKKSLRIITDSKYNSHTSPLFHNMHILMVHDIYTLCVLKFYYRMENHTIPECLSSLQVTNNHDCHRYSTRQTFITSAIPSSKLSSTSLRFALPKIINDMDPIIKNKVYTHSLPGITSYFKNHVIKDYPVECTIPNCYICNRPSYN